ncbi:MAG: hypothetical protein AAGD18_14495 [Actinomycetota bacterium]
MYRRLVALAVLGLALVPVAPVDAQETRTVTGTVVDDAGSPIEGATVSTPSASTVTAADGSFSVTDEANGGVFVQSFAEGFGGGRFNDACLCFDVAWALLDGSPASLTDVELVMPRDAVVRGTAVLGDTRDPVPDVCFLIAGTLIDFCRATAAADGTFSFDVPSDVEITLFARFAPDGYSAWATAPRTFDAGSRIDLEVEFAPFPWVTALVVDELGAPVGSVPVDLLSSGDLRLTGGTVFATGTTNAAGRVRLAHDRPLGTDYVVAALPPSARAVVSGPLRLGTPGDEGLLVARPGESAVGTTDGEGDGATSDDPIETTATFTRRTSGPFAAVPQPVPVSDGPGPGAVPTGYRPLAVETTLDPALLVLREVGTAVVEIELDATVLDGASPADLVVFIGRRGESCAQGVSCAVQADGDLVVTMETQGSRFEALSITFGVPVPGGPVEVGGWLATPHRATVPAGGVRSTLLDLRSTDLDGYGVVRSATPWVRFTDERTIFGSGSIPVELDGSALDPGVHLARIDVLDIDGVARTTTFEVTVEP